MGYYTQIGGGATVYVQESNPEPAKPQKRYSDKGTLGADGLLKHTVHDGSNRPIHEYELPAGATKRSTWMGHHMEPPREQVCIHTSNFNDVGARADALELFNKKNEIIRLMNRGR